MSHSIRPIIDIPEKKNGRPDSMGWNYREINLHHVRKNFPTIRVVGHWNSMCGADVISPSLGVFKQRLYGHLSWML